MKKLFFAVIFAVAFFTVAPSSHAEEGDFSVDIAKYLTAHSRMLPQVMQQPEAPARAVRPLPQPPTAPKHTLVRKIVRIATAPITVPLGAPFVGYYYLRNKVLAHHLSFVSPDDSVKVGRFRWWPHPMRLGMYLANPGGAVHMPPNYTETLTSNLVGKKNVALTFDGPCTVTQGAFIVQVPQGADDFSITSPFVHSSDQGGNAQGCTFQGYTGAAAAFDIGSSAGFTYNTLIRGIHVNLASAQANAIGIRRTNEVGGPLEYDEVVFGPVSGQIGFQFVGTGALFDGTSNLVGLELNSSGSATNNKGFQFTGTNENGYVFVGGHANMGGSANGSVCIDAAAGASKIDLGGFYCDVAATGVTVESTTNTAVRGWFIIDSGVTLYANFAAGSFGNVIWSDARSIATQLVTDNGTAGTNSVTNGTDIQWNSRRWGVVSETGGSGFQIVDKSDSSQAIAKGVSGATHIDSSAGNPVRFNQNSGSGCEFWNAGAAVLVCDAIGTLHPAVVNAVGLGTTALPFLNVFMGTAATNNFKFQPAATTGARIITIADPLSPTTVGLPLTIASGTSTLTANAALAAVTSQTAITTAATGTLTTDAIEWSYASAPGAGDSLCHVSPYVTAGNVNFVRTNPTAAAQNVSAIVINWRVIR